MEWSFRWREKKEEEVQEASAGLAGRQQGLSSQDVKDSDEDDYPLLLSTPACKNIPPYELSELYTMWGRGPIIIDGAPPFGVQLKRQDFERLLTPGQGSQGWVNEISWQSNPKKVTFVTNQSFPQLK